MKFTKMHGLGNDFIVVDGFQERIPENELAQAGKTLCNRYFGIGGDGIILVLPSQIADLRMRVINSDGSEAEMCGNGVRCFAKYAYEHGLSTANPMRVETLAGIQVIELSVSDGKVGAVRVDMGAPIFERKQIPMLGKDGRVLDEPLAVNEHSFRVTCVSMGNPHCVTFVDDVENYPVREIGPQIERHEVFPKKTNVEFIQVLGPKELRMRVWERGCGETMACGTGACASAVASYLNGKTENNVTVHLPGGDLNIEWDGSGSVFMTGPAAEVFSGEVDRSFWTG